MASLTQRHHTNSASLKRFRYRTASAGMDSARANPTSSRSARRHTVRLPRVLILGQGRQYRAQVEQFVLHPQQNRRQLRNRRVPRRYFVDRGSRQPYPRIQLVHRPVSFDPERVFGYSLAAHQAGLPRISASGVYPIDGQPRRVKRRIAHALIVRVFGRASVH